MNSFNENPFPDRKDIRKSGSDLGYRDSIVEQIKSIDVENVDFTNNGGFRPRAKIVEGQKIYFWIRVYLSEEDNVLVANDDISIRYVHSGEILETKFICYAKSNLTKDHDPNVVNYNPEDDKKVLCLMVDSERINKNSDDIPFIRTLFKIGNYYDYQLLKREELELVIKKSGEIIDYFDIDF